jgi:membrane protein implicated in regulation of membrane protease activity
MICLAAALFMMLNPFPEGTLILAFLFGCFVFSYSGGNFNMGLIIFAVTFPLTLLLTWRFRLLKRFKQKLVELKNESS